MKKETVFILLLLLVPFAFAKAGNYGSLITGGLIYSTPQSVTRITDLPSENVHIQDEYNSTFEFVQKIRDVEAGVSDLKTQVSSIGEDVSGIKSSNKNELAEINSKLSDVKTSVDNMQSLVDEIRAIPPLIEQPQQIIIPQGVMIFGASIATLLLVLIIMVVWTGARAKAKDKEEHEESHSLLHLTEYIQEGMHRGASIDQVREKLKSAGWPDKDVDSAVKEVRTMH